MAYAFEPSEPIGDAVRRIAGEQLDRIAAHLRDGDVHGARKRIKESRALLRLARSPLGDAFDAENAWYRDAANRLSDARDIESVVEALERLRKQTINADMRKKLTIERRRLARRHARGAQQRIDAVAGEIADARARLASWPAIEDRFASIGDGAERTLRDGRRAFARAMESPSAERLHDLRKRVKDHWYHVQLLRHLWPDVMKGYASAIEQLSRALGEANDLALAEPLIHDELVREYAGSRRAELEWNALDAASRLFAEKPRAWRKRLRGYWRAAHVTAAAPASTSSP